MTDDTGTVKTNVSDGIKKNCLKRYMEKKGLCMFHPIQKKRKEFRTNLWDHPVPYKENAEW